MLVFTFKWDQFSWDLTYTLKYEYVCLACVTINQNRVHLCILVSLNGTGVCVWTVYVRNISVINNSPWAAWQKCQPNSAGTKSAGTNTGMAVNYICCYWNFFTSLLYVIQWVWGMWGLWGEKTFRRFSFQTVGIIRAEAARVNMFSLLWSMEIHTLRAICG